MARVFHRQRPATRAIVCRAISDNSVNRLSFKRLVRVIRVETVDHVK
jgi:hypothetical protein